MVLEFLTFVLLVGQSGSDPVKAVLEFSAIATTAGGAHPAEPPIRVSEAELGINERGDIEVTVNGDHAFVERSSGRIRAYFGSSGYDIDYDRARGMAEVKPVLSRDRVENLCNLYLRAAWDGAEPLKIRSVAVDDDPLNTVKVQASFTHRGVPYAMHPVLIDLDPLYGRLQTFMCVYPPEPPPNLVPRLSIAEARDRAFEALAFFHGSTILQEVEEFELAIVKPEAATEGRHDWYSAEQLAAGAAGRGILAYSGFFEDREIVRSDGVGWHRYRVVIDAETGRVLALWHFRPVSGTSRNYDPPFGWNLGPGALCFTLNGREVSVEGEIERVAAPAKFAPSGRVIVESNGMSLLAEFDAGQGLLRTITKKPSYGRPDARTLAALAKLHASSLDAAVRVASPRTCDMMSLVSGNRANDLTRGVHGRGLLGLCVLHSDFRGWGHRRALWNSVLAAPSLEFDRVRRLPSPNTELLNHELMWLYTARAWANGQTWRLA